MIDIRLENTYKDDSGEYQSAYQIPKGEDATDAKIIIRNKKIFDPANPHRPSIRSTLTSLGLTNNKRAKAQPYELSGN